MIDHWLPRNKSSKKHSIFHGHFSIIFSYKVWKERNVHQEDVLLRNFSHVNRHIINFSLVGGWPKKEKFLYHQIGSPLISYLYHIIFGHQHEFSLRNGRRLTVYLFLLRLPFPIIIILFGGDKGRGSKRWNNNYKGSSSSSPTKHNYN